jgi:hypothetical protein
MGLLYGRRGAGFGWSGRPGLRHRAENESFDEQYFTNEDEGNQGLSAGKDDAPLGILRFKANTEAWRQKLQRELLLAPLAAADRERITRWLNNLRGREAWQAARLEHTLATKRLLLETLSGGKSPRPSGLRPAAKEATVIQRFTIDPESVRIVVDGRIYTISGSVTGPTATHTRIRVWLGNPATGFKLRDPTLGAEILVSGDLIVDLSGGYNSFSLVVDAFQLPANIPQPPSCHDPWVLTASATGGEAESDPVVLPPPEYACRETSSPATFGVDAADIECVGSGAPQPPRITDPPPGGVTLRGATTYEIRGVQVANSSTLLLQAWPAPNRDKIAGAPSFARVLHPGDTSFSVLVKLFSAGPNRFFVNATDLKSGLVSALVAVPSITPREKSTGGGATSSRKEGIVSVEGNGEAITPRKRRRRVSTRHASD